MKNGLMKKIKGGIYASLVGALAFGYGCKDGTGPKIIEPPPVKSISQTLTLENYVDLNSNINLQNISQATRKITKDGIPIDSLTRTITGPNYQGTLGKMAGGYNYCSVVEADSVKPDTSCTVVPRYNLDFFITAPKIYTNDTGTATIDSVVSKNPEANPIAITSVSSLDNIVQASLSGNQIKIVSGNTVAPYSVGVNTRTATGTTNQFAFNSQITPDQIAFSSIIPGTGNNPPAEGPQIYTMELDGTGLTKLTSGIVNIFSEWSSDGMQIVYQNSGNGLYNIYIMDANGKNNRPIPRMLNTLNLDLMNPSLSPDGKEIVFAYDDYSNATGTGTVQGIGKFKIDGTGFVSLMSEPYSGHPPGNPKFSPNGTMISFEDFFHYGNYEILVIDSAGRNSNNPINLTNNPGTDTEARWLPDGSEYFVSDRTNPNFDVYEQLLQGNARPITTTGALAPDISPDGKKIIFARPNTSYLFLQNFDGTGPVDSVKTVGYAGFPSFRPRIR